jgi:hypothetical protein
VPAWQRNAQLDLKVFTRLCHQLEAGNEITQRVKFSLETSLLAQGSVEFSTEQSEVLYGWVRNIRDYLQGRARGQKKRFDAGSLGSLEICFTVGAKDQAGLNPAQIFALTVALRLRRPEVAVHPTLRDNRAIFDLRSEINPLVPADDPAQPRFRAKNQSLDSLGRFAQAFETALDQAEPGVSFKIASGVPRGSLSDGESRTTLWVVRLSDAGNGIGYRLFNAAAPIIFAVRPLATKPVAVDGQDYDMDALCRGFTRALDELLSPEYAVPARALQVNALEPLLGAKEELATAFSRLVAPVFKSVEPIKPEEKSAAEELLRQRLLVRLSNLYDSAALVQFSTEVKSHFDGDGAPRLYGKPEPKSASNQTPEVSFSSAKLSLAGGATPSLLTFAAEIADQTSGLKESYLPLELEFKATHIEHEIDEGMDGYQPSSWLAFVTPPEPLIQDLGGFNLPRLLRLGPTPPNLKHQAVDFGPRLSPTSLASLLNWDYQFSYSQSYHEPQDKTKFEVTFGPAPEQWLDDEPNPLFNALVKFAAAYPGLLQTLNNAIAKGEGEQEAFAAITALIDEVAVAARTVLIDTAVPTLSELANDAQKYAFTIDQKPIDLDQRAGAVLFLGIVGKPPEGVGEPSVQIEGYVTEPVVEEEYDFGFVFHHGDGETRNYLSAEAGRSIPERTVTLPGLNVLARENAALSAWVVRNENTIDPVRKTSPEFIYESARSEPGFRVYPMIEIEDEIRIHEIGGTARRSLAQHLGTFWSALFAESSATQCILQLECSYGYRLDGNSILPAIRVPVLFRPPAPFQLPTQNGQGTMIPAAVENLAKAMDDWAAQKQPSQTQAELSLDITIFTSSGEQTPLLQLHNAVLAVSSLEPGW